MIAKIKINGKKGLKIPIEYVESLHSQQAHNTPRPK